MKIKPSNLVMLVLFLAIMTVLANPQLAEPNSDKAAEFVETKCDPRVRAGASNILAFTIFNRDCSENDTGDARFSIELYLDRVKFFDEYNSTKYKTWVCNKGQNVSHRYEIKQWSAIRPQIRDLQVNLYWVSNGVARLEDSASFKVSVTQLIPLQHIYATGYLAAYLVICFLLLAYDYIASLGE